MFRFTDFEALGLRAAVMSDRSDGDFAQVEGDGGGHEDFLRALGVDSRDIVLLRQVHGTRIVEADGLRGEGGFAGTGKAGEGDGLVTGTPGLPLAVCVADCVPVFLFDPFRGAGGVVHAGREGTFNGIVGKAVEVLEARFGVVPEHLHALIGPSAGPCCYRVSEEIAKSFYDRGLPVKGRLLDLWGSNVQQLAGTGIPLRQISVCGICTICDGRFHSHRAEGGGGRNLALLVI